MVNELRTLHDNFVVVPAHKTSNNIVFVCKNYYYECLLNEVGFTSTSWNPTYTSIGFQNYIKILTNKDTLLVPVNALLSQYRNYSLNC
jgi:hypothetical protein